MHFQGRTTGARDNSAVRTPSTRLTTNNRRQNKQWRTTTIKLFFFKTNISATEPTNAQEIRQRKQQQEVQQTMAGRHDDNDVSLHPEYRDLQELLQRLTPYNPHQQDTETQNEQEQRKTATNKKRRSNTIARPSQEKQTKKRQVNLIQMLHDISQQDVAKSLAQERQLLDSLQQEVTRLRREVRHTTNRQEQKRKQRRVF